MPKYLLTLGTVIFAVLFLPSPALSQEPLRPASMFNFSLLSMVNAGYLVATARIERIQERTREVKAQLVYITFDVELSAKEVFFGPEPVEDRLKLPPLKIPISHVDLVDQHPSPEVGDLVFVILAPIEDGSYRWVVQIEDPIFGAVNPVQVEHLRKASRLLSMEDRELAVRHLLEGCSDEDDPVFAEWCVTTLDPRKTRFWREEEDTVYGPLRAEMSVSKYLATLWQLVEEPSTHALVFVAAVSRLFEEDLTEQDHNLIHEIILRRFSLPLTFALDDQDLAAWNYEIHQLMIYVYPELRQIHRDEMLSRMRLLAGNSLEVRCPPLVLRYAAHLYPPGDEDARRHIFQFYKDFVSIVREDRDLAIQFHYGFQAIMQWEGRHSKEIHWTSLHFLRSLLTDEQLRWARPAKLLQRYVNTYLRYHKKSDELSDFLRKLLPQVENFEDRQILEELSKQLNSSE